MLERDVKECPLGGNQLVIDFASKPRHDQPLHRRILGECGGSTAMDVPRKLVEHNDERNGWAGIPGPHSLELSAARALVKRAEPVAYLRVVLAAVAEPHLLPAGIQGTIGPARAKPEFEHLLSFVHAPAADRLALNAQVTTRTSVVTEFAMKHSLCALSCSHSKSAAAGIFAPLKTIFGCSSTRVTESLPCAFLSRCPTA